jgi:hypothetical protein
MDYSKLIVDGNCSSCGSKKLVVTQQGSENHIVGHCLVCNAPFSGALLVQSVAVTTPEGVGIGEKLS